MHAETITPTTATPPPNTATPQESTPAENLQRARALVRSAFQHTDDDSIITLTWIDRDEIARLLCEAICLIDAATKPAQEVEAAA